MTTSNLDAVKLIDLLIDLLQKVQQGHVTLHSLERLAGLGWDARNVLMLTADKMFAQQLVSPEHTGEFELIADLGIITVPYDYDHINQLNTLHIRYLKDRKLVYYDSDIIYRNFPYPTRIMNPGDKFRVRAFKPISGCTITSKECLDFLRKEKAVFTGAQGASLVLLDQKRELLRENIRYASLDEENCLWTTIFGQHKMPVVHALAYGGFGFRFYLDCFERVLNDDDAFFCFSEAE